jgi:hypothetical protein
MSQEDCETQFVKINIFKESPVPLFGAVKWSHLMDAETAGIAENGAACAVITTINTIYLLALIANLGMRIGLAIYNMPCIGSSMMCLPIPHIIIGSLYCVISTCDFGHSVNRYLALRPCCTWWLIKIVRKIVCTMGWKWASEPSPVQRAPKFGG